MIWFLLSCATTEKPTERTPVYLSEGRPFAGVAEAPIDFPVGTPLGYYSARCTYLGGSGRVDQRRSAYAMGFSSSAGIQTMPMAKAFWIDNDDQHLVLLKADIGGSYDNLVEELEDRLEDATGISLDGRVVVSASHTHHAPGPFSDQIPFYLAGDRYNEEIFQRLAGTLETIALEAYASREAASIGFSVSKDWDPDDKVYRDRRPENDDLAVWDDVEPGYDKDPYLWMMKINKENGDPMGLLVNFGIHGTLLGTGNALFSSDAPGHIEYVLQERFAPDVVVSHFQGAGGDASPADNGGLGHKFARLEGIGEAAVDAIMDQYASTPTSSDPFTMDMVSRSHETTLETINVTRNNTVDWQYKPYDPNHVPDDVIYDENGDIISPLDEFNAQYGGIFCGYDDPLISTGTLGSQAYPYDGCTQIELLSYILWGVFDLESFNGTMDVPLPLPATTRAPTTNVRLGPMTIKQANGEENKDDVYMGFFPGETTGMFLEQFRRRAKSELGFENTIGFGYSQDHEGYFLIPEDWLLGGYEPNITFWGPLYGEYVMEGALEASHNLKTDLVEPHDPHGIYQPTTYAKRDLPQDIPDETPTAGMIATEFPEDFYAPLSVEFEFATHQSIKRVQGLAQLTWEGGDPAVDTPRVEIERKSDGEWIALSSASGRVVSQEMPDIILSHTPTPLYPAHAMQTHTWWAAWQTVGPTGSRLELPTGIYRFHVYGNVYDGGETWPWSKSEYEVIGPEFEIVEAELDVQYEDGTITLSLPGPEWGYRLIDIEGNSQGDNPPIDVTLEWVLSDGNVISEAMTGTVLNGRLTDFATAPESAINLNVTDAYGNFGSIELDQ